MQQGVGNAGSDGRGRFGFGRADFAAGLEGLVGWLEERGEGA